MTSAFALPVGVVMAALLTLTSLAVKLDLPDCWASRPPVATSGARHAIDFEIALENLAAACWGATP